MGLVRLGDLVGSEFGKSLSESERTRLIAGITCDSRQVKPGYLFAALPGTKADGASFIPEALKRGATALLSRPGLLKPRPVGDAPAAVLLTDRNPRRRFALMAAGFYGPQPKTIAAITGTNGKTSIAGFLRQIWEKMGLASASIGTLGVLAPCQKIDFGLTTPDPAQLHEALATLKARAIEHVAIEASSHGLAQYRLDGVQVSAAAITNLTRDHLDYHARFEDYAYAKLRLFGEVMAPGGLAVVNADASIGVEAEALSWARGHRVLSVGVKGHGIKLLQARPNHSGQDLDIVFEGRNYRIALPLAGSFQASNALIAAALAIGLGGAPDKVFAALETLEGAPGRLELAGRSAKGAPIYIDYAHTPDALETVLAALRGHVRGKLTVVFGCGGDRDPGKRPQMGEIATRLADTVIVTDDNPRSEDPAAIRAAILAAAPGAREIGDRAAAIATAIASLDPGDVLIVAGKGHETGQIVGEEVRPFSDAAEIRTVLGAEGAAA
jgi:UDP-N-acetylmuramoyl-L-alanyl-D-glutamate--2,6-diaminopimelate ligase